MLELFVCLGGRKQDTAKLTNHLVSACSHGDPKKAKRLLRQGACPDGTHPVRDQDGNLVLKDWRPIFYSRDDETARVLIEAGADLNAVAQEDEERARRISLCFPVLNPYTALDESVHYCRWSVAETLLAGGAHPLGWWSQVKVPRFSLRLEPEPMETQEDGTVPMKGDNRDVYPPLISAMIGPQLTKTKETDLGGPLVDLFLKNPEYLEPYCEDGSDVLGLTLVLAIQNEWFDLVDALLARGKPSMGWASVVVYWMVGVREPNPIKNLDEKRICGVLEILFKCGADPNYRDGVYAEHPLAICSMGAKLDVAKVLIVHGADVDLAVMSADSSVYPGKTAVEIAKNGLARVRHKRAAMVALLEDRAAHRQLREAHLAGQGMAGGAEQKG